VQRAAAVTLLARQQEQLYDTVSLAVSTNASGTGLARQSLDASDTSLRVDADGRAAPDVHVSSSPYPQRLPSPSPSPSPADSVAFNEREWLRAVHAHAAVAPLQPPLPRGSASEAQHVPVASVAQASETPTRASVPVQEGDGLWAWLTPSHHSAVSPIAPASAVSVAVAAGMDVSDASIASNVLAPVFQPQSRRQKRYAHLSSTDGEHSTGAAPLPASLRGVA
jgi:hypothetical protein